MEVSCAFVNSPSHHHGHYGHNHHHGFAGSVLLHHESNSSNKKSWNLEQQDITPSTKSTMLDHFQIEDLLDFSNEDIAAPITPDDSQQQQQKQQQQQEEENNSSSASAAEIDQGSSSDNNKKSSSTTQHADEFSINCDDMPELEFLSSLVDDGSFSIADDCTAVHTNVFGCFNAGNNKNKRSRITAAESSTIYCNNDRFHVLEESGGLLISTAAAKETVPGRPRSKRLRTGMSTWTSCVLNGSSNSSTTSPATSAVSAGDSYAQQLVSSSLESGFSLDDSEYTAAEQGVVDSECKNPSLMLIRTQSETQSQITYATQQQSQQQQQQLEVRRCTHCLSTKTPQWRAGPAGPKTLCNACGVRFKSGRLFPEYRPALSPTFLSEVHSNSHRKVLEMRRQKEQRQQKQVQHKHHHQHTMLFLEERDDEYNDDEEASVLI